MRNGSCSPSCLIYSHWQHRQRLRVRRVEAPGKLEVSCAPGSAFRAKLMHTRVDWESYLTGRLKTGFWQVGSFRCRKDILSLRCKRWQGSCSQYRERGSELSFVSSQNVHSYFPISCQTKSRISDFQGQPEPLALSFNGAWPHAATGATYRGPVRNFPSSFSGHFGGGSLDLPTPCR